MLKSPALKVELDNGTTINLYQTGTEVWRAAGLTLKIKSDPSSGKIVFKPVLEAEKDICGIAALELFSLAIPGNAFRILRFGLNMPGDQAGFYRMDGNGFSAPLKNGDRLFASESADKCRLAANSLLCFKPENSGEITLLGAASFDKTEGTVEFEFNKAADEAQVTYKMILDNMKPAAGQTLTLDNFVVMTGHDLNRLLEDWAELTARNCGARVPANIPAGWNDWQYYRNEKTAADVLASAEVIGELKKQGYPLDFVQVDGGFCLHLSEWTQVKPEFAPGIKELSGKIRDLGLKFGLWFAPYIQNVNTSVVKQHPEWLLKDADGKPVILGASNVGRSCLLDYTVPGTEQWLREQLRRFVKDWQVAWIKLDGPNYALYRQGRLHDRSKTISEMLNRTFEIIREEAGTETLVEGEGMMGLALGKVDLHRVQTDNHPKWYDHNGGTEAYAPRVYGKELLMGFLHGRWWCNHRENVILRNYPSEFCHVRTANPQAMEQAFNEPEFRTQLTAAVMGSGGLLLTDPMRELMRDSERFAWIAKLLPVYNRAAKIVDAFPAGRYPAVYKLPVDKDLFIYSFTNWNDKIEDFKCELPDNGEFHAYSVFERKVLGIYRGSLEVAGITAHDSRIVVLKRRKNRPQLIAADLHLLPGTVDVKNCRYHGRTLEFEICHFKQDDNSLFLAANGHGITGIETDALRFSVDKFDPEYPVIRFQGRPGKTVFRIEWSKNLC
ncbi:MAG: alpha-galactosidase [Victivallaceae bacterium]